jgi:TetR/AcrR family acrAB operon transcriptional repressor
MRRTREEALETRDRILDCAEQVFVQKGVPATTLLDIASAAGVTRGAIYGHFANKTDVFNAMVARVKVPMDALFEAANDPRIADPIGALHGALTSCLREVAVDLRTRRVLDVLLSNRDSGQADWLRERNGAVDADARARLARGLRNAVRKGQLPADLDTKRGAALPKATLGGILREWLVDPAALSLPADADRLAQATLDMLRFSPALRKPLRASPRGR